MSEIQKIVEQNNDVKSTQELLADSKLTSEERQEIKNRYETSRDELLALTKTELKGFIESDYGALAEKMVGKQWIKKAAVYFWVEASKDGTYTSELFKDIIEFQETNNLAVDGIIWPATLKMMSLKEEINVVPWAENINEVVEKLVTSILTQSISVLNEKWEIALWVDSLYDNLISILERSESSLSKNNLFNGSIDDLKTNFLLPREKGKEFISYILEKKWLLDTGEKKADSTEISQKDIDMFFTSLQWWINFLYDTIEKKWSADIAKILTELKKIPSVKDMFENIPVLEKVISDIIPAILQKTPRDVLNTSLSNLYSGIKTDIYTLLQKDIPQDRIKASNLNIMNKWAKFLWEIVNKQQVNIMLEKFSELDFIKKNDKLSSLIGLLNTLEKSNDPDKRWYSLKIAKKIIEWMEMLSKPDIKNEDINKYIWGLSQLIKELSGKVPDKDLKEVIKKFYWLDWKWNEWGLWIKLNKKELAKLLLENENLREWATGWLKAYIDKELQPVKEFMWMVKDYWADKLWIKTEKSNNTEPTEYNLQIEDFILEYIRNWKFDGALNEIWGKVVETLKKVIWIDLRQVMKDVREKVMEENYLTTGKKSQAEIRKKAEKQEKIEWEISDILMDSLWKSVFSLIKEKMNSWENSTLSKEELISLVKNDLQKFLHNNIELVIDYINTYWEKNGVIIDAKKDSQALLKIIDWMIWDPRLVTIISKFIWNIGKSLDGKTQDIWEIKAWLDEMKNTSAWKDLLAWTQQTSIDLWVDVVFDTLLSDKDNLKFLLGVIPDTFRLHENISNDSLIELWWIIKKFINKEAFKKIVWWLDFNNISNIDLRDFWKKLFTTIDNKTGFLDELIASWFIDDVKTIKAEKNNHWEKEPYNMENIYLWVDLLYSTLETSKEANLSDSLNKILKEFGMKELAQIQILGKNFWESIVTLLQSTSKEDLIKIIKANEKDIWKLIRKQVWEKEKIQICSWLSMQLAKVIDIKKFQGAYKWENLSKNETLLIDLTDEFQGIIQSEEANIRELTGKWYDLYKMYKDGVEIKKGSLEAKNMNTYAQKVFDIIHKITAKIDSKYLEQNLDLWQKEESEVKNKALDTFVDSFIANNFWFILGQALPILFWRSKQESLYAYFSNPSNKDDFWDTMQDFFVNVHAKKQEQVAWNPFLDGYEG